MAFASNGFNISDAAAKSEASDRQKMWHKRRALRHLSKGTILRSRTQGTGNVRGGPSSFPGENGA